MALTGVARSEEMKVSADSLTLSQAYRLGLVSADITAHALV